MIFPKLLTANCQPGRKFIGGFEFLLVGALLFSLGSATAGAQEKPAPGTPASDVSTEIGALGPQILATPLDESDALTGKVQKLVLDDLQNWFAKNPPGASSDGTPYEVRVRREMEFVFSKLHYPVFGTPRVLTADWKDAHLTVCGYTLGWSDYDRVNVVALFETRDGKTNLAGVDHFVQRTDLHLRIFPGPDASGFRFLAYGSQLGKSQPRLSAMLYGFNGQTFNSLWHVQDMYDGRLQMENGTLVIRYLREQEYIHAMTYNRRPPRHMATYKPSADGLQIVSDREIPF